MRLQGSVRIHAAKSPRVLNVRARLVLENNESGTVRRRRALHKKSLPEPLRLRRLDVRRGYASPLRLPLTPRLRRSFGLCPKVFGPEVERGAQPQ